ncbi:MAG: NADH-quinone oxidoreductase subunit A [Terriglobia bacterium]
MSTAVWPIGLYFILVVILIAAMLGLSYVLGERHNERATGVPYESGVASEGSARVRFPARFYMIAMFFVVFDLEAVFIFAWAVSAKEVGWAGYWEILVFVGILVATLIYLWRLGALEFGTTPREKKGAALARK